MSLKVILFTAICIAMTLIAGELRAEGPPDGIYRITGTPNKPDPGMAPLDRVDGGEPTSIERLLSLKIGSRMLISTANDNSTFNLHLKDCGPIDGFDPSKTGIVVDGLLARIHGHNRNRDSTYDFVAKVDGPENAARFAKALGAKVIRRDHPGHQLFVQWRSCKQQHELGDDVQIEVEIKNVGEKAISFVDGGRQRGPRDNQFQFIAVAGDGFGKPLHDIGDGTSFGGIGVEIKLEPGESFKKQIGLGRWFKFQRAGTYRITGSYQIDLSGSDGRQIWNDYATGRCSVRVVERFE